MDWEKEGYNFPGWPLENNPFGTEFNEKARKRMITGSETLLPTLYKYKNVIGKNILEIGPFFNPITNHKNFPKQNICYWENDSHVLQWLNEKNKDKPNIHTIFCDLNQIEGTSQIQLKHETNEFFKTIGEKEKEFHTVILSQVFNYIDYKLLLLLLGNFIKTDSYVFINNTVNYGIPHFFSDKRPKSNRQIIKALKETGYKIIEKEELDPLTKITDIDPKKISGSKNKRLILVAQKI